MKLTVNVDPTTLEIVFTGKWKVERKTLQVIVKSVIATLATTGSVLFAPELLKIGTMFGWW